MQKSTVLDYQLLRYIKNEESPDKRLKKLLPNYKKGMIPVIIEFSKNVEINEINLLNEIGFNMFYRHTLISAVSGYCNLQILEEIEKMKYVTKVHLSKVYPENPPPNIHFFSIIKLITNGIRKKIKIKKENINNNITPDETVHGWQNQESRVTSDIKADKLWEEGITGEGVTIGIVDTGVNKDLVDIKRQNWLDWETDNKAVKVLKSTSFVHDDTDPGDISGHGSGTVGIMAGTAYGNFEAGNRGRFPGIAPDANIISAKAFTYEGDPVLSMVLMAGMEWCVHNGADVICMFHDNDSRPLTLNHAKADAPVANLIEAASKKKNILFSFAGGNNGPYLNSILFPASSPFGITAGATSQKQDFVSSDTESGFPRLGVGDPAGYITGTVPFSASGPDGGVNLKPDIVVPGANIVLPYNNKGIQGTRMKMGSPLKIMSDETYLPASGTSVAASVLAGSMALLVQKAKKLYGSNYTYYRMKALLMNSCCNNIAEASWYKPIRELDLQGTPKYGGESASPLMRGAGQINLVESLRNLEAGFSTYTSNSTPDSYNTTWNISNCEQGKESFTTLKIFNNNKKNIEINIEILSPSWVDKSITRLPHEWINVPVAPLVDNKLEIDIPCSIHFPKDIPAGYYFTEVAIKIVENENIYTLVVPIFACVPLVLSNETQLEGVIWSGKSSDFQKGHFNSDWHIIKLCDNENAKADIELIYDRDPSELHLLFYDSNYKLSKESNKLINKGIVVNNLKLEKISYIVVLAMKSKETMLMNPFKLKIKKIIEV